MSAEVPLLVRNRMLRPIRKARKMQLVTCSSDLRHMASPPRPFFNPELRTQDPSFRAHVLYASSFHDSTGLRIRSDRFLCSPFLLCCLEIPHRKTPPPEGRAKGLLFWFLVGQRIGKGRSSGADADVRHGCGLPSSLSCFFSSSSCLSLDRDFAGQLRFRRRMAMTAMTAIRMTRTMCR